MKLIASQQCLNDFFDQNLFHGAVLVVYQNQKKVFDQSFGFNDFENQELMTNDKIFRAYSMTKLVTIVATFLCLEKKLFTLDDQLDQFFPQFKQALVLVDKKSKTTEAIQTPITIHHLLTMTSGLTYFGNKNWTQIQTGQLLEKLLAQNSAMTLAQFVEELAKIPLLFQPGTSWNYGVSFDVLGAIIEKVSHQSFRDFCWENIFVPLKMTSTDFYLLDPQRQAFVYQWNYENDQNKLSKDSNFHFLMNRIETVPLACLGGSGLFTTGPDFGRFLNLFLDGCDLTGKRILSQESVAMIKSDQLKELRKYFHWTLNQDYSYGFGVRIRLENDHYPFTNIGECGWDGYLGSAAIIDSEKQLVACLMLSTAPGHNQIVETKFFEAFYKDLSQEL